MFIDTVPSLRNTRVRLLKIKQVISVEGGKQTAMPRLDGVENQESDLIPDHLIGSALIGARRKADRRGNLLLQAPREQRRKL